MIDPKGIFERIRKLKVLVIGDSMLDTYIHGNIERISPEAPVPVCEIVKREHKPGGAANVALNCHHLGAETYLMCLLGNDNSGDRLVETIHENGIELLAIRTKRQTTVKTRILGNQQHMIRLDEEDISPIRPETEELIIEKFKAHCEENKPDVIILQDYNKGMLTDRVISSIITFCNSHDIFTAADPKHNNFFSFKNIDLFKPNIREVSTALQKSFEANLESLSEAADKIMENMNCQKIMITLGKDGIFYKDENQTFISPAFPVEIADVCGAGDTVISLSALMMAEGIDTEVTLRLANTAAGHACERLGVYVPDSKDIIKWDRNLSAGIH